MQVPLAANAPSCARGARTNRTGQRTPVHAVVCANELKIALNRIAQRNAVSAIPKRHAIVKTLWIAVRELQGPGLPRIGRLVNARLIARPGRQQVSFIRAEGLQVTEVERFSAGYLRR